MSTPSGGEKSGIRNLTKNPLGTKCFSKTNVVQLAGAGDTEIGFLCFTETFCGRAGWNYYCWSWIIAMASGESGKAARDNKENIVLKTSARAEWCFYFYLSFIKSVMDLNRTKVHKTSESESQNWLHLWLCYCKFIHFYIHKFLFWHPNTKFIYKGIWHINLFSAQKGKHF